MSTKIYNGYAISGVNDCNSLMAFLKDYQNKVTEKANEIYMRMLCAFICDVIDRKCVGETPFKFLDKTINDADPSKIGDVCIALADDTIKSEKSMRRGGEDFKCEIVVFPKNEGKTLALIYSEMKFYEEIWENMPGVEYYGYWDNSDEPEDISCEQFRARGNEWDEALGGDGWLPASKAGLTMTMVDHNSLPLYPTREQISEHIMKNHVDFESRVVTMARRSIMNDLKKKLRIEYLVKKDLDDFLNTDEGKAEFDRYVAEHRTKLIPDLAVFLRKLPE